MQARKSRRRVKKSSRSRKGRENDLKRGKIRVCSPASMPPFPDALLKPSPGAQMTVRQLVGGVVFDTHTGVGAGNFMSIPTTAGTGAALSFALADMPQQTSFAAIYDQYRIDEVEVHFVPIYNVVDSHLSASPNNGCPPAFIVLDYDDSVALTSEAQALEYDNCQLLMPYNGASVKVKPKITPATYASGAFDGYLVEDVGPWIDVASTTVQHYGVKMWLNPLAISSTETLGWYVYGQYTVSFANVR